MQKLLFLVATSLIILIAIPVWAGSYQYMEAKTVKLKMSTNIPLSLVDIQVEEEFNQHHIQGALATYSYPVKSDSDRAKLEAVIGQLKNDIDPVVVVCPRGGGGAKRAYDYLAKHGIAVDRLFILKKGQADWPYPELLAYKLP